MAEPSFPPRCEIVPGAVLGPGLAGSGRNRLRVIADTGTVKLRHFRPAGTHPPADVLDIEPPPAEASADAPLIEGDVVWGGLFKDHFGHMAAEGVHRLWAVRHLPGLRDAKVAFHATRSHSGKANRWFAAMLRWLGVKPDKVVFVNRVTRIERLFVPDQAQTLEGWPLVPHHKRLLPAATRLLADAAGPDRLYVSRRLHIQSGTYLGESYIEDLLVKAGFTAIIPEQEPVKAMLAKIAGASQIVFAEGSAIHHLDLLRHVKADIFVIGRRTHSTARFGKVLGAACDRWRVFEPKGRDLLIDWEKDGRQHRARACAQTDLGGLVASLSEFLDLPLPAPEPWIEKTAPLADLARFLLAERLPPFQCSDDLLGRAVRLLRESPVVKAMLAD